VTRKISGSGSSWSLWPARPIKAVDFKGKVEPIFRVTDKEDEHRGPPDYNNKGRHENVCKRTKAWNVNPPDGEMGVVSVQTPSGSWERLDGTIRPGSRLSLFC